MVALLIVHQCLLGIETFKLKEVYLIIIPDILTSL